MNSDGWLYLFAWALLLPIILLMIVRMAWNKGMGTYASASS